jgi:hypothetical protein
MLVFPCPCWRSQLSELTMRAIHHTTLRASAGTVHRLFQDDLASVSISRLRASGVVTGDTKSVDIVFGEGDDGLRRDVKVVHRQFPNGGEWSFFICPVCGRPARVLKLHEKPMCRRCCLRQGSGYRVSSGTPVERDLARVARLKKLRELLDGGSVRLRTASWTALGRLQFRGGEGGSRASRPTGGSARSTGAHVRPRRS